MLTIGRMGFRVLWGVAIAHLLINASTYAQVIPDETLGGNRSTVRGGAIDQLPSTLIEGGAVRGNNLFHSFRQFDVQNGQGAYFVDPGVRNIIGRVTGGDRSEIFGRLGVLGGDANLFLMNPEGFLFGPDATLDLNGSFAATSADEMQFGDVGSFRTLRPNVPSDTLTIDPSAFLVNQLNPGRITSRAIERNATGQIQSGLIAPNGRSLVFLGGEVLLENTYLQASEGRVEIAGLSGLGRVDFRIIENPAGDINQIRLTRFPSVGRADITLTDRAVIDVTGANRGDIALTGQNVELSGQSTIRAGLGKPFASSTPPLFSGTGEAGNIVISAADEFTLRQGSEILNRVDFDAVGNSTNIFLAVNQALDAIAAGGDPLDELFGSIFIFADAIEIIGNTSDVPGRISTSTSTSRDGNAGLVFLSANDSILIQGIPPRLGGTPPLLVSSRVESSATGSAGGIFIQTGALRMTDSASISTSTFGNGNPGLVSIVADNPETTIDNDGSIELLNGSSIFSNIGSGGSSNGDGRGIISLSTGSLTLRNGSELQTSVLSHNGSDPGVGNAGAIFVDANSVLISDSKIFSDVETGASGDGGIISITADDTIRLDNAFITTSTSGSGRSADDPSSAGLVRLEADRISLSNSSFIFSNIESGADNAIGGAIVLFAEDRLSIFGGSQLQTIVRGFTPDDPNTPKNERSPAGNGDAGNIVIVAGSMQIDGFVENDQERFPSAIFSQVGARVDGNGGNIIIAVEDNLALTNAGLIDAENRSLRNPNNTAGNIFISVPGLFVLNQGFISAQTRTGNGGNFGTEERPWGGGEFLLLANGSQISTSAGTENLPGDGGNIALNAGSAILGLPSRDANITARAFEGDGGNITINGTVNFLDIAPRSENFPDSNDITADSAYGDDGQVTTNGLDFDPSRGIIELPADLVEPTVAQVCPLPGGLTASELSEFYVTGRGGLPTAPDDPGSAAAIASDWVEVPEAGEVGSEGDGEAIAFDPSLITPAAVPVEFQTWQIDDNGDVLLLASTATPVAPPVVPQCQPAEE